MIGILNIRNKYTNLYERLKVLSVSRVLIAFTLCLFTLIFLPGGEDFVWGLDFFVILGLTFSNLCVSLLFVAHLKYFPGEKHIVKTYVHLIWDTLFSTSLVYLSGIKVLYLLTIVNASFLLFWQGAFAIASLGSVLYALLLFALFAEKIPMVFEQVWKPVLWNNNFVTQSVVIHTSMFLISAWVFSRLASRFEKAEEKLRARAQELEVKANEAQELAAIGEMSARMAHEIRNPLTSISGAIQILQSQGTYSEEDQHLMEIVLKETDRLNTLLTEFLSFARPAEADFRPVEFSQVVEDVLKLFSKVESNQVHLDAHIQSGVFLDGDEKQLSQLTWNLVKNASDAAEQDGCVSVALSIKDSIVSLQVKDNGPGIPEGLREKIFDPFFTTKIKGSGLGLAVVQRIAKDHRGRMFVESSEGQGTEFSIDFPPVNRVKGDEDQHA